MVGPIGSVDEAEVRLSQGGFDLAIIDIELLVAMRAEAAGARS